MRRPGVALAVVLLLAGCRSALPPSLGPDELAAAVVELGRPLPGGMAALYRLRVPRSSGLRLAVNVRGQDGRMSVTQPFAGLLSLTAWSSQGPPTVWDIRHGCRLDQADLSAVFGVSAMPLPQAVRLLGGRLPAEPSDAVMVSPDGRLLVVGEGWGCTVEVAPAPWRVVRVAEAAEDASWSVELGQHGGAIPRAIRLERRDGRWARLELVRLEWNADRELAPLPDLPPCGSPGGQG